ncbi:MAG: tyrosine-type recombinase/integrase [Gammaproteobacteria bacterium]|nr:tyrosine-type recombinase/integrase [Gammaproteobacteria bacterium]
MQKTSPLITTFLGHFEFNRGRAQSSVDAYLRQLTRLQLHLESIGKTLELATPDDLSHFTGKFLHDLGIAPRSRRQPISAVKTFYKWLKKSGVISKDPAAGLSYPATGRRIGEQMSLAHLEDIFQSLDLDEFIDVRDMAILGILAGCGLRVAGLVALNRSDLTFDRDVVTGYEYAELRVTEKGGHERIVPVPDEAHYAIRAYYGHSYHQQIDASLANGDQPLFLNTKHPRLPDHENVGPRRRLTRGGVLRMIKRRGAAAGVDAKYCHPHALRHLYGTELIESGVDSQVIGSLMGHSDPKSTKVYLHLAQRLRRDAVRKGNPLSKIKTPLSGLVDALRR